MSSEKGYNILTDKLSYGKLLKYVFPTIFTVLFASLYGVVDGIFVSKVGGSDAFAAVNLVTPIFLIISSFGMMFGTGGNALVAKIRGEGKKDEAKSVFTLLTGAVVVPSIVLSVVLMFSMEKFLALLGATPEMLPLCLDYSRVLLPFIVCFLFQFYFQNMLVTAGKAMLGFVMTVLAGVVNIVGDAILVGVLAKTPAEAVMGAAWATVFGVIIGGLVPFIYFFFKNSSCLRFVKPEINMKVIGAACSNGISEFLSNISGAIMNTVFNTLLLYIVGRDGVAAFGSISYINTIFCAIFMGYSVAVAPIISYRYGAKDTDGLKDAYKKSLFIIGISSVVMVALGELLAQPLSRMFSSNDETIYLITVVGFRIYAISFLYKGINTFVSSFFTALNDGFVSGLLSVCRALVFSIGFVIMLPLIYLKLYGAYAPDNVNALLAIWWSVNYAEGCALILSVIYLIAKKKKYQY